MDRTFLLPLVSLTALGSSGCGAFQPAIVGDWIGVSYVGEDGSFYNLPHTKSYTDDGVTYTETFNFTLSADRDGSAVFGTYYEYSSSAGDQSRNEDIYAAEWERDGETFELTFQADLRLDCTADSGELVCEALGGAELGGSVLTFEPAED